MSRTLSGLRYALAFLLAVPLVAFAAAGRLVSNLAELAIERQGLAPGVVQRVVAQPFTNVVATGMAICDLRSMFGYCIERITLRLAGTSLTKAMLTSIQLKANGKVILDTTGSRADARQAFRGLTANAGFLQLDFLELRARSKLGMVAGALDTTLGIKDLRLEVQITGATAPILEALVEVSVPQKGPEYANLRPLIARVHSLSQTIGGAGTFPLTVPHLDPNAGGSIFKRIAVFSANMTGARVERNGIREVDVPLKAWNDFVQTEYGRAIQAGLWSIDFIEDGLQEDRVLDTRPAANCSTANVFGTFSAGETITIEAEVLEPLDVY
jgi:hypothetical protein